MLLKTNTVTESNRDLLRILMAGFYLSSEKARNLHKLYESYVANAPERQEFHLRQAWKKVAPEIERGPLSAAHTAEVSTDAQTHYKIMMNDTKERFFAHLIEFVQILNLGSHQINPVLSKTFKFAGLPNSDDFNMLRQEIRRNVASVTKELKRNDVRELILADFTPAKVSFNVVPIRPDITVVDPMVMVQTEDPNPPGPPAAQIA